MCLNNARSFLLLVSSGSDELGESSPEGQHLEPLEVGQLLPTGLAGVALADRALVESLLHVFFGDDFSELSSAGSTSDLKNLLGELEPPDGDGLAGDAFSVDEDALVSDDIHDGGELAFEGAVVDAGDSTDLDEPVVSLS